MSPDLALAFTIGAVVIICALIDKAPKIIESIGGVIIAVRHARGCWDDSEVGLALTAAIRRTDPDLSVDFAESLAAVVLEDLAAGVLTLGAPDAPEGE